MIRTQIKVKIKHTEEDIRAAIIRELKLKSPSFSYEIVKESLDARKKDDIFYLYTVNVELQDKNQEKKLINISKGKITEAEEIKYAFKAQGTVKQNKRPVVVGAGPAGLFAAYMLSCQGYKPIVIERGESVFDREKTVNSFWAGGTLNTESNVQFGEGGAGTFSDGKLNTGVKDKSGRIKFVLDTFIKFGADPKIGYANKPHIGTDVLKNVVKNIREASKEMGATFRFNTKLTDLIVDENNVLKGVRLNNGEVLDTEVCILAPGHSSRDTFKMLSEKKLSLESKSFAIGVRLEHLQEQIGRSQYCEAFRELPAADYKMTGEAKDGRGVYSFCMCPGGFVVNASSEEGRTCVNGMSNSGRNERNANAAIIVQVNPEDFQREGYEGPLSGVYFQQKWETECYRIGNGKVPVQRFEDFKKGQETKSFGEVIPNTKGEFVKADLTHCLPNYVKAGIITGVEGFDRRLSGFSNPDAILSGVETRTSSPLRILRDENLESDIKGLYPCGEGAGYAGGIMSAAVDGIKVFEAVANKYKAD